MDSKNFSLTLKSLLLCFSFSTLLISCTESDRYRSALKLSGENIHEFELLIDYYSKSSADSLKLKAAKYLIANMPGHYSYKGRQLTEFNTLFDKIAEIESRKPFRGNYNFPVTNQLWDSIASIHGGLNYRYLKKEFDLESISSEYLIENIEQAFKVWKLPWAEHLSFNEFCEYILPYRFENENIEPWRELYKKQFARITDSCMMVGVSDPVEVCRIINKDITSWFRFNSLMNKYPGAIGPRNLLKAKMGKCLDQAGVANFSMRANGVPVVHEYIPQWASRSMGHDFSAVLGKDGNFLDFLGGELPPGENEIRDVAPKIYRKTFSIQEDHIFFKRKKNEILPPKLNHPWWIDVTSNYIPVSDIEVGLSGKKPKSVSYAYLSVFNNHDWIPVAHGAIKRRKAKFADMGRGAVYLPVYYSNSGIIPAANPLIIYKNGKVEEIKPEAEKLETVCLERKYPLSTLKLWWMSLLIGGRFEGANRQDFSDAVTLYTIKDSTDLILNHVQLNNKDKFRYVRYLFSNDSYGSVSELVFMNNNMEKLEGKIIHSAKVTDKHAAMAFDNKLEKYIGTEVKSDYNSEWIGLDFGIAKKVQSIGFAPRTDTNNIFKGNLYELLYWDNKWISLGRKVAEGNSISYENVPKGALLWLRNHTAGKEERIFQIKEGKQVWW